MVDIHTVIAHITTKKEKLDSFRPLPPDLIRNLDEWFSLEFTYTSNALEGNTLSMSETALVVEKGITVGGKTIKEHLEAINHSQAIALIEILSRKKQTDITMDDILAIHKMILQKIDDLHAGLFRKVSVRVVGSTTIFPNYTKIPPLMVECMQWLHSAKDHPIIIAALAHLKLVTIHPFVDGNGRTARLLMNLLLLQNGYPLAIIKKEDRKEYIHSLEHAQQNHEYKEFFLVICKAVEYSIDAYLEAITESQPHTSL